MRARLISLAIAATVVFSPAEGHAQEYRAFWVDTFNTSLNTLADVRTVVANAKLANANAIFAQVRRRGDSWYLNSLEPLPDLSVGGVFPANFPSGFDPLQALITEAHANGIEVHAFVIIGAIWNKNPTFASSATLGPPTNPNHVFNRHGGYDPVTRTIVPGPNNWLTRTLIPDGTAGIAFQGHRFGSDFWIDLGHPAAAAHSLDVLLHLVRNYNIDGLHLDRIRYPEISVSGQTPSTGTNIGYNAVSVARFQQRYGLPSTPMPAPGDPLWMQWRRDQVTSFVRRLYLNVNAIRPSVRISAALIAFGNGPLTDAQWTGPRGEAYWRVYQDWRAWTEEGILDIAIPMNYKSEHTPSQVTMFNEWNEWLKNHQYNRAGMIGMAGASPINSVEGLLRQTRRALAPSSTGKKAAGVIYFSMANTNGAVTNNPFALPVPANTPTRTFAQFASGLTTGRSGTTLFEDPVANPVAVFSQPAFVPDFAWKSAPTKGHLMGIARRQDGSILDTADVVVENVVTASQRNGRSDGNGFYGSVDLEPGSYFVKAVLGTSTVYGCVTNVLAGRVATADLAVDNAGPALNAVAPVVVAAEPGLCSAVASWSAITGSDCLPFSVVTTANGQPVASGARFPIGSTTVTATATDRAGNSSSITFPVTVVDAEAPVITGLTTNRPTIWPPNHKMVDVRVNYSATDNCSVTTTIAVSSSDPGDGAGDGNTEPDFEVVSNREVRLRAERSAQGGDRVYTITVTAVDPSGNTSTASTAVVVPHDQR